MTHSCTRREALSRLLWLSGSSVFLSWPMAACRSAPDSDQEDEAIFAQKVAEITALPTVDEPFGDLLVAVALSFRESPYVAHSLELPGPECLVVNFRGFDCLTFVESSLSLARCVRLNKKSFQEYRNQLQSMRYRSDTIDGYPSRLHYFTDWVQENQRKGIVTDMSRHLGGEVREDMIDFMSTHKSSYRQLESDEVLKMIAKTERELSATTRYFIPQDHVEAALDQLHNGDIIGVTSTVKGLDIAHTGLAYRTEGTVRLLHASSSGRAVEVSKGSLADYVTAQTKQDGLIVVRPMEPA